MYRTTQRIRKAGVAALVAATALSGLAFVAPSAGAAAAINTDLTLTALSSPTIAVGKANQAAGSEKLTLTTGTTLTAGDQILVKVDDSDGANCVAPTDTIGFTALPTVSVTGTASMVSTIESSAACVAGAVKDVLRLNVTGSGTATVNITGVAYTVGAGVAVGAVSVTGTLNAAAINTGPAASNAFVSSVFLTANNPPKGNEQGSGTGFFTISPIVLAEQTATAADTGLCLYFNQNAVDTAAPAPTVAVSGGTDAAALTVNAGSIFIVVTPSGPASTSTLTISGVRVANNNRGVQTATVFKDTDNNCSNGNSSALSIATNVGGVTGLARYAGSDRFATAQKVNEDNFGGGCGNSDWAIIARADEYPDALAASYLAGMTGAGILLTNTNSIPSATLNALRNEDISNVYVLGGTNAISAAVATQLANTFAYCSGSPDTDGGAFPAGHTLSVTRIGGADRFETARMIAEFPGLGAAGSLDLNGAPAPGSAKTAIVTSGLNFPDALAAGALAASGDNNCCGGSLPLLLSGNTSVPAATMAALTNLGITNVVVVGGPAAVSDSAVAQLTSAGYTVRRIAGANRQATATELATAMAKEWGYSKQNAIVVRGDDFADALNAGPLGGSWNYPILLTGSPTSLSADTAGFIRGWKTTFGLQFQWFQVLGGTSAVSTATVQEILDAASQQ